MCFFFFRLSDGSKYSPESFSMVNLVDSNAVHLRQPFPDQLEQSRFFFCFFLTPTFLKTKRSTAVPGSNKLLNGIEYKCIPVACLMLIFWLQQVFSISGWREFLAAVVSSKFSLDALFIGNGHDDDGIGRLGSSCCRRQLFFFEVHSRAVF